MADQLITKMANELVTSYNKLLIPVEAPMCKVNIAGFSLDDFKTFNPDGYSILCRLGETCDGLNYFPQTSKIVLDNNQQSQLLNKFDQFIPNIAKDLQVSEQSALEKSVEFFSDKQIVVQPTGIQGKVYNVMRTAQNYAPMAYTHEAVALLKTSGMTGVKIITQAPLTFVGATYIGALFFGYFGSVAGDNAVGAICNGTSFILSRPMRGVEITLNGLILRPISNRIGLPLILNGTQEMLVGKGLSLEEYTKIGVAFERMTNSTIVKKTKKIYRIIRDKDK